MCVRACVRAGIHFIGRVELERMTNRANHRGEKPRTVRGLLCIVWVENKEEEKHFSFGVGLLGLVRATKKINRNGVVSYTLIRRMVKCNVTSFFPFFSRSAVAEFLTVPSSRVDARSSSVYPKYS